MMMPLSNAPEDALSAVRGSTEFLELSTAARLARGSLFLFALYNTPASRQALIEELTRQTAPMPNRIHPLSPEKPKPGDYLQKLSTEQQTQRQIIHFIDVETAAPEALRWFDLQRDSLNQHPHVLIVWMSTAMRAEFARTAPNFFSRHSGVFDLRLQAPPSAQRTLDFMVRSAVVDDNAPQDPQDRGRVLTLYKNLLADYQNDPATPAEVLIQIYIRLCDLEQANSNLNAAQKYIRAAKALTASDTPPELQAQVLFKLGNAAYYHAQMQDALQHYQKALQLFRSIGAQLGEANVLAAQARLRVQRGELAAAENDLQQVILKLLR